MLIPAAFSYATGLVIGGDDYFTQLFVLGYPAISSFVSTTTAL